MCASAPHCLLAHARCWALVVLGKQGVQGDGDQGVHNIRCPFLQADDVTFMDRTQMVLLGAALKEAALPPGTLAHLAERFLPAFAASVATHGQRWRQAAFLLVRRPQCPSSKAQRCRFHA
jgi:hypothetical protein